MLQVEMVFRELDPIHSAKDAYPNRTWELDNRINTEDYNTRLQDSVDFQLLEDGMMFDMKYGSRLETLGPKHSRTEINPNKAHLAIVLCSLLLGFNIAYEMYTRSQSMAGESNLQDTKTRMPEWDVVKFLLMLAVVLTHTTYFIFPQAEFASAVRNAIMPFMMPAFVLCSGIFGASVAYESVSRMICYTAGMTLLFEMMLISTRCACGDEWSQARKLDQLEHWYVAALLLWRLLVTPLFHLLKKLRIPGIVGLLLVLMVSYILHITGFPLQRRVNAVTGRIFYAPHLIVGRWYWPHLFSFVPWPTRFDLIDTAWFAPMFATGLLCSANEWCALMHKNWFSAISILYCSVWYASYVFLKGIPFIQTWLQTSGCGPIACLFHAPVETYAGPISIWTLFSYIRFIAAEIILSLAVICTLVSFISGAKRVMPGMLCLMAEWGSRTLYTYIIHVPILIFMMQGGITVSLSTVPSALASCLCFLIALALNMLLASKGTELLFGWIIEPYWMKHGVENLILLSRRHCCADISDKSACQST